MNAFLEAARRSTSETEIWGRSLDFDAKRAGRAVVNLHLESGVERDTLIYYKPMGLKLVVVPTHMLIMRPTPTLAERDASWDLDESLWPVGADVDAERVVGSAEDPDMGVIQWFAKHQAEAKESMLADAPTVADAAESQDEAILTRRKGRRSSSWRGGGTMRRR
jgi:hypothetical protein